MNFDSQNKAPVANANASRIVIGVLMVFLSAALPATASLGGSLDSVDTDRTQMKAAARIAATNTDYTVHEIQVPNGTIVREYATLGGQVFAVTWRGAALPNLQQLLGKYFEQYVSARKQARLQQPGHGPLSFQEPLVVCVGGNMRFHVGKAYLPKIVPTNVKVDQIQ